MAQDAGEIPIGLYLFDKTPTWWLPVLLVLSLLIAGVQVVLMLQGDLGNGGPGDGGGGGRGPVPGPPDPNPLRSRIQFKQVINARATSHAAGRQAVGKREERAGLDPAPPATISLTKVRTPT